jgi:hypothetical protein
MSAGAGWRLLALLERLRLGGDSASDPGKLRLEPLGNWGEGGGDFCTRQKALEILTRSSDSCLPAKKTNNLA